MNTHPARSIARTKAGWADYLALILAVIVAGVFPLYFRNQFFDINRAKLDLLLRSTALCALACAVMGLADRLVHRGARTAKRPHVSLSDGGITLFIVCAAVATALSPHRTQAITGGSRKSGLIFLLALYLLYLTLSRGLRMRKSLLWLYFAAGCAVALLGVHNYYQIDPFRFYQNMKANQIPAFISTIGNINFFGFYLCMTLSAGSAMFLHAKPRRCIPCGAALFVCFCGTIVSRSDGALLGVATLFVLLLFETAGDCRRLVRVGVMLLLCGGALSCVRGVGRLTDSTHPFFGGLSEMIVQSRLALVIMALGAALTLLAGLGARRGIRLPRKALRIAWTALVGAGVLGVFGAMLYFTSHPELDAGMLTSFLRFDDAWGSHRGFVWKRAMAAYARLDGVWQIFGVGPDTMRYVLEPYRDSAIEAVSGVFDNCHNEYLQYLVTTGALGLSGYVLLIAGALNTALRRSDTFEGLALTLMLCVYAVLASVNVNQPVTVVQLFFATALAESLNRQTKEACA